MSGNKSFDEFAPPPLDIARTASFPPASKAETNRYTLKIPATATISGNFRVRDARQVVIANAKLCTLILQREQVD
jgi:hypothetical protein